MLTYGSFAIGQGVQYSDIEFYVFFQDEALEHVDRRQWVAQIRPVALYYVNEAGNEMADFDNLVRGESHFECGSRVGLVAAWEVAWFPSLDSAVLVDGWRRT